MLLDDGFCVIIGVNSNADRASVGNSTELGPRRNTNDKQLRVSQVCSGVKRRINWENRGRMHDDRLPELEFFISEDSGETMVVRTCALDSGTLTVDTELVRMSHCGSFYFDDRYVRGCVVSCSTDACNSTISKRPSLIMLLIAVLISLLLC